jgi:hypothetical protein
MPLTLGEYGLHLSNKRKRNPHMCEPIPIVQESAADERVTLREDRAPHVEPTAPPPPAPGVSLRERARQIQTATGCDLADAQNIAAKERGITSVRPTQ